MSKKKVLLLTYGNIDHASSRIRGVNHFERLKNEFDTTWVPRVGIHHQKNLADKMVFVLWKAFYLLKKYFCIVFMRYDIVFIQILFLPEWLLKILKRKGSIICYDFDDAVYTYSKTDFDRMISYADKIIIASPFLQDSFDSAMKEFAIIYSPVDTDKILAVHEEHQAFTIGWIGSPWTGPYLLGLEKVFQKLATQITFKILVVGALIKIDNVPVECIDWNEENELSVLKKIDVGIMPLPNDGWAKMKGGYKLYLYMAAAKPVIASPYGINSSLIKEGKNGYLAATDEQWLNAFITLQADKYLQRQLGKAGRKDAEDYYSYKVCSQKLLHFLIS